MFDKEYSFRGKHAEYVSKLTAIHDTENGIKIFNRNLDVYIMAPIVGFLYGRTAEIDKSTDKNTKIFVGQLFEEKLTLEYNFKLIMLLDKSCDLSVDDIINRAFRDNLDNNDELYNSYVLGGVEILYEKILAQGNKTDDFAKNLYEFLGDIEERYNGAINEQTIVNLCLSVRD